MLQADRDFSADVDAFAQDYGFELDDFQVAGAGALAEGRSTLVAAPTGAGKTVVGEFAVWWSLQRRGKCFYTTPIKALSNQKYNDLVERHGDRRVGLLTGDNVVNGDAEIVVMTTEVLRNMLYEGSSTLRGLYAVVLDEVHYLADRERGAIWEEVIIQLPQHVQLACLSATVSNAEEFGAWLRSVRQSCDVVISERRPVPLEHSYAVNDRLYPVFKTGGKQVGKGGSDRAKARGQAAREALAGVPNPDVIMLERQAGTSNRVSRRGRYQASSMKLRPPRRSDIVRELRRRRWLPAIYFLFSRSGCDAAVQQLMTDNVTLTSPGEREAIRRLIDERTAELPAADLEVLGYGPWAASLERGVAAHHAGMVPVFKETVEALFVRGLLKVCFATETLALGINMPARTVIIERLEKWNGQTHEVLTPGQFTQLTGRAGRRGLDAVGHAVVLYQRDIAFTTVASLVGRRTEPLRSSFAPSYNMAVNLLRSRTRDEAEALLARSFAQYQADHRVAGEERRIAENNRALQGYAKENLASGFGDFDEYWALRREQSRLESQGARDRRQLLTEAVVVGLERLRDGDVVALLRGRGRPEVVAVVDAARSRGRGKPPLVSVVGTDSRLRRIGPREFDRPPVKIGWVRLPASGNPRQDRYRRAVVEQLRHVDVPDQLPRRKPRPDSESAERVEQLRRQIRDHPVHRDPHLPDIEVWARRYDELKAETEKLERSVRRRTGSLVRQFDRILGVLVDLGYLTGEEDPQPTGDGMVLAALYAETDLVLTQALRAGLLEDLDTADLAAVASAFVYETRSKEIPPVRFPSPATRDAVTKIIGIWEDVAAREEDASLPVTRLPDPGFSEPIWRWVSGADLDEALAGTEMTPGDFVRAAKQVNDLLRQLRDAVRGTALSDSAHDAAGAIMRGVVAYSGV
ncbi:MAG: DEAD/DEAH box helicase [Nitriliruptorales bacterium]|nr:DEAD/DEAH box helicase [Nitriliruptorales bacterium]